MCRVSRTRHESSTCHPAEAPSPIASNTACTCGGPRRGGWLPVHRLAQHLEHVCTAPADDLKFPFSTETRGFWARDLGASKSRLGCAHRQQRFNTDHGAEQLLGCVSSLLVQVQIPEHGGAPRAKD